MDAGEAADAEGADMTVSERWAERDAKREAFEAEMRKQAAEHREAHIKIVRDALWQAFADFPQGNPNHWATVAVDALLNDGVVFARLGACGEGYDHEAGKDGRCIWCGA